MATDQKIAINLWFDNQAEEVVNYYLPIFEGSRIIKTTYFGKEGHEIHNMPEGLVMAIEFELLGSRFVALNGGPVFTFSEATSFIINCGSQAEVDYYWGKLTQGGDESAQQCGWLKDKYGVSWQVVPAILSDLFITQGREKAERVMKAMLQMKKLDIVALQNA